MNGCIKLDGIWDDGYAVDYHTISSEYLGEDPFGNKRFDTTYTRVGELLHKMKYNGREDTSLKILDLCIPFLNSWLEDIHIDCILPMPPSEKRSVQPVFLIAKAIANHYNIPYTNDVLYKNSKAPSKNLAKDGKDLTNTIEVLKPAVRHCNLLLIDDLFSTGATATACTRQLKEDPLVDKVYIFVISKTRT